MSAESTNSPTEPPRKRRRPALSCFECRRRKIKCDRNYPCNHCVQSKIQNCNYSPDAAASVAGNDVRNASSDGIPAFTTNAGAQLKSLPAGTTTATFAHHFPTPGSSPKVVLTSDVSRLVEQPSRTLHAHGDLSSESIIKPPPQFEIITSNQTSQQPGAQSQKIDFPSAAPVLHWILVKNRLFGPSNFKNSFEHFEKIRAFVSGTDRTDPNFVLELHTLVNKCKDLGTQAKAQRPSHWRLPQDLKDSVPPREVADDLKGLYLRNFESVYRIVHIPSFQDEYEQYWINPKVADDGFVIVILLVMAIGTIFYDNTTYAVDLRSKALEWIHGAQSWLSGPSRKNRLAITGLQVQCLLLIARQTNFVGPDLVWISAGSLVRTAINMGLHRDPGNYPKMSEFHREMRRRLWTTILEMAVQSSLDCGMPAMISLEDFDTLAPKNIDDDEISTITESPPSSKPETTLTQTSMQIILLKTVEVRLEVARLINHFRSKPTYEDVLSLSSKLFDALRDCNIFLQTHQASKLGQSPTVFQRNFMEHILRRFILALHRPFVAKSLKDPRFYFSRKVCLDQALVISSPQADQDYYRLIAVGGGMFREVINLGASTLCRELITQLEEDSINMCIQRNRAQREPLYQAMTRLIALTEEKLRMGETNVKPLLFLSMCMGQMELMEAGTSPEEGIASGAKRSITMCYEILKARVASNGAGSLPDDPNRARDEGTVDAFAQDLALDLVPDTNFDDIDFEDYTSWLFPTLDEIPWKAVG